MSLRIRTIQLIFFSRRRRLTGFDCDWSSDVCSSDLAHGGTAEAARAFPRGLRVRLSLPAGPPPDRGRAAREALAAEIGRASCRGRGEISVVAVSLKKKKLPQPYSLCRQRRSNYHHQD